MSAKQKETRETGNRKQEVLAAIGQIALDNDALNYRLQQNQRAVNSLREQLSKILQEERQGKQEKNNAGSPATE